MNQINVKLEHCYGIGKLNYTFDFTQKNAVVIYAPNGTMKTSFAKTFRDVSASVMPKDLVDANARVVCEIKSDGTLIDSAKIYVANPEEDVDSADSITSLMASDSLKERYENIRKELDSKKKIFLKKLKDLSKSSDCETELFETFTNGDTNDYDFAIYDRLEADVAQAEALRWQFKYNDVFDIGGKVRDFIAANRQDVEAYFNAYKDVLSQSTFFKVANGDGGKDFGTDRADALLKSIKDNAFFKAGHKIVVSSQDEITSYSALEELKKSELERILSDPEVKRTFDAIDKKLSANQQLKAFKDAISEQRDLLLELLDYDQFKRNVWFSFIAGAMSEYMDAIQVFRSKKEELEQIYREAEAERSKWENIIDIFNTRFHAPFEVKITNQRDLVLKRNAPSLKFFYVKTDDSKVEEDKSTLMQILSKGEQRAFSILQIVFQVEERKNAQDNLLIFDDISDSFDYKNKYAIIEYLADYIESGAFRVIILTHNFDFYRTIVSRLGLRNNSSSLMALKNSGEIKMKPASDINDVFGRMLKAPTSRSLLAMIPFVRNIVEYLEGNGSDNYLFLTFCLHYKQTIPLGCNFVTTGRVIGTDIIGHYVGVFPKRQQFITQANGIGAAGIGRQRYVDWLKNELNDICREANGANFDEINLTNKVVLAIGIRLITEKYILDKLQAIGMQYVEPNRDQTKDLIENYKRHFCTDLDYGKNLKILIRVGMMTPEQIHLNSFMYEPLVDMSVWELLDLYIKVSAWNVNL